MIMLAGVEGARAAQASMRDACVGLSRVKVQVQVYTDNLGKWLKKVSAPAERQTAHDVLLADDDRLAATARQLWEKATPLSATGHNEGRLTDADISAAAKAVKFDAKTAPDVQGTLDGINTLAQQLGFSGTPALVVLPSTGASADSVTVIPGYTSAEALQQAISHAAGDTQK